MNVTRHLRVSGRVQGVGYREALRREALACGLAGWVRNRRDGTVEALLQGEAGAVERVIAWAQRGPPRRAWIAWMDNPRKENSIGPPRASRYCPRPSYWQY
jgi:acylphosphatase